MCYNAVKVKSLSPYGVRYAFVPCGKCAECRKSYQSQWFFRLAAELDSARRKDWNVGFFTLTYNDEHLPRYTYLDKSYECFRRQDVRRLILRLRKQYHREFGVTELVYLVASEFGSRTKRPHYHGIIAFPPVISAERMLSDIKRYWSDDDMVSLGFVFPSYEQYATENFLCKSAFGAAQYAAKYCCKDLNYDDYLSDVPIEEIKKNKDLRSFHIQSRSLGLSLLKGMSDEEKYDLYVNGLRLVGSSRSLPIPLYIKNKIFFDPVYLVDDKGNRQVLRVATAFVRKYAREIYDAKVNFYRGLFDKFLTRDFWSSLHFDRERIERCYDVAQAGLHWFGSTECMAQYYCSYYGVAYDKRGDDLVQSWLNRYHYFFHENSSYSEGDYCVQDRIISYLMSSVSLENKEKAYEKMVNVDDVLDFHHNCKSSIIGS